MSDERAYPITPAPDDDPRFNAGLLYDVAQVLEAHDYPRVEHGRDLVDCSMPSTCSCTGRAIDRRTTRGPSR